MEVELKVPAAELVDVDRLRVDGENPNRMRVRRFEALNISPKNATSCCSGSLKSL